MVRQRGRASRIREAAPACCRPRHCARGIDVEGVSHVINFELPNVPETTSTASAGRQRAGAAGIAIAFCGDDERAICGISRN